VGIQKIFYWIVDLPLPLGMAAIGWLLLWGGVASADK
jgi:hypothetical protein